MPLGRQQGTDGEQRRGVRRTVAPLVAGLTLVASVVLAGEPAGSADRNTDRQRSSRRAHPDAAADDGTPARFVAEIDGQIAIVSADSGRVERHLTADKPGRSAQDPTLSPDGRTVWFSRGDGPCAAHLASVPVAGGSERKLPGSGESGPEAGPLPRPGHAQLAYSRSGCNDDDGNALVVGDLSGLEGHGQIGLVPLAWSRDGDHLLATTRDKSQFRLLDVDAAGAIVADRELDPADGAPECRLEVVGFSSDDNDGYVAVRRCGPSGEEARRSLVLLYRDGRSRKAVLRLPRGQDFVDRPAFDPTGHALLYSTAPAQAGDGPAAQTDQVSLWLWRDGQSRLVARQSRYRHPAWLP